MILAQPPLSDNWRNAVTNGGMRSLVRLSRIESGRLEQLAGSLEHLGSSRNLQSLP